MVTAEKAYFATAGIFPIMHLVVLRRDVYESHPWVAQSLYKAFARAKEDATERLYDSSVLRYMVPWLIAHIEEARDLLGDDFWSYGLEANRETLATFVRYHYEQGLAARPVQPEELFAPETTESFVI